jgi:hypothetical protein
MSSSPIQDYSIESDDDGTMLTDESDSAFDQLDDDSMGEAQQDDDSASDAGSISDSGFNPINSTHAKGKGKSIPNTVDYSVLSINQLLQIQKKEVDHVVGIIGMKVSIFYSVPHSLLLLVIVITIFTVSAI